ncbi:MAG: 1-phosphofructokinase [Lachnospiraceae bacterium]
MIYTVTFNPSLDYIISLSEFSLGSINRTETEHMLPGGKGINVSIVLNNLEIESKALGFIAGFTGREIEHRTQQFGCSTDFIELSSGLSRINVKLSMKPETEINGQGPIITEVAVHQLFQQLDALTSEDILILAGSIPNTMPNTIYEEILERMQENGCKIVVDATGDLLVRVLKYHPFLIKPNHHELAEIFQTTFKNEDDLIFYTRKIQEMGARNVLISMAGDGAILLDETGAIHKSPAPKGTLVNSVGAGDSMVAGFVTGYLKNADYREAFYMGVATGSASAFSKDLATKPEVMELLDQLTQPSNN